MAKSKKDLNRYSILLTSIFKKHFVEGNNVVGFERQEINQAASELGIMLPKNLGDVLYSFRYRVPLPDAIRTKAPEGYEWIIRPTGRSHYQFALVRFK